MSYRWLELNPCARNHSFFVRNLISMNSATVYVNSWSVELIFNCKWKPFPLNCLVQFFEVSHSGMQGQALPGLKQQLKGYQAITLKTWSSTWGDRFFPHMWCWWRQYRAPLSAVSQVCPSRTLSEEPPHHGHCAPHPKGHPRLGQTPAAAKKATMTPCRLPDRHGHS